MQKAMHLYAEKMSLWEVCLTQIAKDTNLSSNVAHFVTSALHILLFDSAAVARAVLYVKILYLNVDLALGKHFVILNIQ